MYQHMNYFGTTLFLFIVIYLSRAVLTEIFEDESALVDEWLDQNDLGDYKKLFRDYEWSVEQQTKFANKKIHDASTRPHAGTHDDIILLHPVVNRFIGVKI